MGARPQRVGVWAAGRREGAVLPDAPFCANAHPNIGAELPTRSLPPRAPRGHLHQHRAKCAISPCQSASRLQLSSVAVSNFNFS